ncbi:MAG TPA: hypothetical protein DGX96_03265 [Lachnospiraceae bacterium]|nr:hypothetical protein [Lachnospiraceae bacterium]
MLLGAFFRRIGLMPRDFAERMNTFVFKVALPVLLFEDLATTDLSEAFDARFVLYCFLVTLLSIGIAALLSIPIRDRGTKGEFIQASYRSSAALLGVAFIEQIYGTSGMAPMMILGAVPLYNICAVIVLQVTGNDTEKEASTGKLVLRSLKGILTNPLIIGIVLGFAFSLLGFTQPKMMSATLGYLSRLSSPMGLMALGATFSFAGAKKTAAPAIAASLMKLLGFSCLFLPLAVHLGFRNEELVAIIVMLGSPTTVASYVMARNMHHDGDLSASAVALTTLLSAFTLTLWLFVTRSLGLI